VDLDVFYEPFGAIAAAHTHELSICIYPAFARKIEEDAKQPQLIVTVKGVGYKFVVQERPAAHNFVPRVA
jgi:DNA-binding winged helix-turn-helix (wHTH) protein